MRKFRWIFLTFAIVGAGALVFAATPQRPISAFTGTAAQAAKAIDWSRVELEPGLALDIDAAWADTGDNSTYDTMDNAAVTYGGKIYNFAGYSYYYAGGLAEEYNPGTGIWTTKASAPHSLDFTVAATVWGSRAYIVAGQVDGNLAPAAGAGVFQYYDLVGNTWNDSLPAVPGNQTWGAQLVTIGDYVYLVGGGGIPSGSLVPSNQLLRFNANGGSTWETRTNMPAARSFHCAWVYNGFIVVAGGNDGSIGRAEGYIYNPTTNSWTADPQPLPATRWGGACAQVGNSIIYAAGVDSTSALALNSYIRDLSTVTAAWTVLGNMAYPVYRTSGTSVGSTAYVVNGSIGGFFPWFYLQENLTGVSTTTTTTTDTGATTTTSTGATTTTGAT
ncbi:hypothetical protein K8I61_18700, partial [bacterium]|nr:hypothetical protein [bacterium]